MAGTTNGRTPGIGLAAGLLGFAAAAVMGNEFQPLPAGWHG